MALEQYASAVSVYLLDITPLNDIWGTAHASGFISYFEAPRALRGGCRRGRRGRRGC